MLGAGEKQRQRARIGSFFFRAPARAPGHMKTRDRSENGEGFFSQLKKIKPLPAWAFCEVKSASPLETECRSFLFFVPRHKKPKRERGHPRHPTVSLFLSERGGGERKKEKNKEEGGRSEREKTRNPKCLPLFLFFFSPHSLFHPPLPPPPLPPWTKSQAREKREERAHAGCFFVFSLQHLRKRRKTARVEKRSARIFFFFWCQRVFFGGREVDFGGFFRRFSGSCFVAVPFVPFPRVG